MPILLCFFIFSTERERKGPLIWAESWPLLGLLFLKIINSHGSRTQVTTKASQLSNGFVTMALSIFICSQGQTPLCKLRLIDLVHPSLFIIIPTDTQARSSITISPPSTPPPLSLLDLSPSIFRLLFFRNI